MCRLMLIGLPGPSSTLLSSGSLISVDLAVTQLEPSLGAAADHPFGRDAVGSFRIAPYEVNPAPRNDERLEPIRFQVRQQLELRLVDAFLEKLLESWVSCRIEPRSWLRDQSLLLSFRCGSRRAEPPDLRRVEGRHRRPVTLEDRAIRLVVLELGISAASCLMRSNTKNAWKYIGCSHQRVPSLSNVAMRSAAGTKSGPPSRRDPGHEIDDRLLRFAVVPGRKRACRLGLSISGTCESESNGDRHGTTESAKCVIHEFFLSLFSSRSCARAPAADDFRTVSAPSYIGLVVNCEGPQPAVSVAQPNQEDNDALCGAGPWLGRSALA